MNTQSYQRESGILVPGGFGQRGTEGMILAIKWAREQKVPFLGICLGFQMAVLEWARNVLGEHGESPEMLSSDLLPQLFYQTLNPLNLFPAH